MSKYINEAFRQFTLLEDSEEFALTPEGIDNLGSFMDTAMNSDDLGVQVIDPEADDYDELNNPYNMASIFNEKAVALFASL